MGSKFAALFGVDSVANVDSETTRDSKVYLVSSSDPKFESARPIMQRAPDSGHWNVTLA